MTPDSLLARMTLEQKAGQVMAFGFDGAVLRAPGREMIERLHPGGVVLFARNVESPHQLAQLTGDLQRVVTALGDPALMISIDQEGGRVARLRREAGFTEFESAQSVGSASDPANAAGRLAQAIAGELKPAGINTDLAPVLDVNINPDNPVINDRSFGANPGVVSACGVAFIQALQAEGVMAVGKHFPGHGDTTMDSHVSLPVVFHDRARLEAVEFVPFAAAIEAGVGGIMSSHIWYPAIEPTPNLAATLSSRVMTDLLRDAMKFEGIRMTDSLEMGALQTSGYPVPLAAVTALNAGADMLLFNCGHALNYQAHAALVEAARQGEIPIGRLDEAVSRILLSKERFGILAS